MNVGIIGAGRIAGTMARTLKEMEGVSARAIASRDINKAQPIADMYKIEKAYGSYEELLNDPKVDLIYIATPHSHHYEHIKMCIEAGKHVLCEKAFTVNARQAEEVLNLGRKKNLLVAEALWTRYLPMRKVMDDIIAKGVIGNVVSLMASLCQPVADVERMVKPELAGGALLDQGVYTINFALMCFGPQIKEIASSWVKYKTGVDALNSITFVYDDGKIAILESGFICRSDRRGVVSGDRGYIEFFNINNCEGIKVYDTEDKLLASHETPKQITGYEYEITSCKNAIEAGKTECPEMPHTEILQVMGIMDKVRKDWGLQYPCE
ncbi:MAG: Gfo/Idh/MocA family oxidoreductase [Treponema sp.]|jgi:predicted dehydrogenase|nr:Gfo/Idh/MocA family oxidoreductase [Treponema sp.]